MKAIRLSTLPPPEPKRARPRLTVAVAHGACLFRSRGTLDADLGGLKGRQREQLQRFLEYINEWTNYAAALAEQDRTPDLARDAD